MATSGPVGATAAARFGRSGLSLRSMGFSLRLLGLSFLILVAHAVRSDSVASTQLLPNSSSTIASTVAPPEPAVGSYNVSQSGDVCLLADLALGLRVQYETIDGKIMFGEFNIEPKNTRSNGSCGADVALLTLTFPEGVVLATFAKSNGEVSITMINATLNHTFPAAKESQYFASSGLLNDTLMSANNSYKCVANMLLPVTANVTLQLSHVHLQPFDLKNGTFSPETECSQDLTTQAPNTTHSPNTTTHTPTTSSPPFMPGKYNVSDKGHACLLLDMAVEVQVTSKNKTHIFVVHPSLTSASGNCHSNTSLLNLTFAEGFITFVFINNNKRFFLEQISINLMLQFPTSNESLFVGSKGNLTLFDASLGSSYMCKVKQNESISDQIMLMVSDLRLQPFKVQNDAFSTAENCQVDDLFLAPVIVGAVLAGLVIAVVIAFVIGRRRRRDAGYQHF